MIVTYALLTLALLALWFGGHDRDSFARRHLWLILFAGSLAAALIARIVQPLGVVWILAFAFAAWTFSRERLPRPSRIASVIAMVILAAGLMTHRLPGFDNPLAISPVHLTADASTYRLHLNYDKTVVGLFILGWCHVRLARASEWRTMLTRAAPAAVVTIVAIIALALAAGYVRFDPKFPRETWLWAWVNLCFTCVAEEALFRGFVQAQLARAWQRFPRGEWLALLVAAVLFGVAHLGGGMAYVALSTVAGLGYGWAYLRSGRIEASILTHFALNAVHFLGFTYPALQRT